MFARIRDVLGQPGPAPTKAIHSGCCLACGPGSSVFTGVTTLGQFSAALQPVHVNGTGAKGESIGPVTLGAPYAKQGW
jgi:hypothetical protein